MTRDGDTMAAWLREAADELDKAHALLDDLNVPRAFAATDGPIQMTLAARIAVLDEDHGFQISEIAGQS